MRILHVSHAIPPDANTGVENYTVGLARAQRDLGHTMAVFTRGYRKDAPAGTVEESDEDAIHTVRVQFGPGHHNPAQRTRWGLNENFRRFVREWTPDVVHFQHLMYHSLDLPRLAAEAGAATLLTLHDFWFTCPVVQRRDYAGRLCQLDPGHVCAACTWGGAKARVVPPALLRRLSENAFTRPALSLLPLTDELADWKANTARALSHINTLISPSRFVIDDLTLRGVQHPRLLHLENGIPRPDMSAFRAASRAADGMLHLGIIGSHFLKGAHVAVEAFRRLPPDFPARLHLWGTAEWPDAPPNVMVEGRFAHADLEQVYGGFDALIVPSIWYENAPFVIREAFARGLPVLASDIGGMAESVRDGVDGLHFAVGNADALVSQIRRLVEEPELLDNLRGGVRPPTFYGEHLSELMRLYHQAHDKSGTASLTNSLNPKVGL